jgi:hypothetical protein
MTTIATLHSSDEYLGRAIAEAVDKANAFLARHPTAEVLCVQTLHEMVSGDYPYPLYTHLVTIVYREEEPEAPGDDLIDEYR